MKTWQLFALGAAALVATLFLSIHEAALAALGALFIVAVVTAGFLVQPRRQVFYVRTTTLRRGDGGEAFLERDCLAVRLEVTRLWLLFVPTFVAMAFLLVTSARGTTWNFSLFDHLLVYGPSALRVYYGFLLSRGLLLGVIGILSTWVSERWALRDAEACSPRAVWLKGPRVSYSFVDRAGEFYGGEVFQLGLRQPAEVASLVLYNTRNPALNRIALGCWFHRLVVVGRGVTDLDEATVAAHAVPVHTAV